MTGRPVVAVVVAMAIVLPGCRPAGVHITFRPERGARFVYAISVESESTTDLDGDITVEHDTAQLRAVHDVLATGPDGTRVRVRLSGEGRPRTFVVALDRSGGLASVERVENVPARALGSLGLAEIFPAASTVPDRELRPGERWEVKERVSLPDLAPAELAGTGRVARLGTHDGEPIAYLEQDTTLVLPRPRQSAAGEANLHGRQRTASESVHAVRDGAIERVSAVTRGSFALVVPAPPGGGAPVTGTVTITVTSTTRLLHRE